MGDLTTNLSRSEFSCRCGCGSYAVDYELVSIIQTTADELKGEFGSLNVSVEVKSGHRCEKHNASVGGAKSSTHVLGMAADLVFHIRSEGTRERVDAEKIYKSLDYAYPNRLGLGIYDNNRIHLDTRATKARWDKRRGTN